MRPSRGRHPTGRGRGPPYPGGRRSRSPSPRTYMHRASDDAADLFFSPPTYPGVATVPAPATFIFSTPAYHSFWAKLSTLWTSFTTTTSTTKSGRAGCSAGEVSPRKAPRGDEIQAICPLSIGGTGSVATAGTGRMGTVGI